MELGENWLTIWIGSSKTYDFSDAVSDPDYVSPSVKQWAAFLSKQQEREESSFSVPEFLGPVIDFIIDRGLDEVGLFRLSGDTLAVEMLVKRWKSAELAPIIPSTDEIHVVCSALKKYFRDMRVEDYCTTKKKWLAGTHVFLFLRILSFKQMNNCLHRPMILMKRFESFPILVLMLALIAFPRFYRSCHRLPGSKIQIRCRPRICLSSGLQHFSVLLLFAKQSL